MDLSLIFPFIILLLFIPIFLSSRKQKRVMQEMQSLQASLEPGDVVMTTSGLRATVVDASYEDTIDLEIADGVVTTWVRAAVKEKVDLSAHDLSDHERDYTADDAAGSSGAPHEPSPSIDVAPSTAPSLDETPSLEKDDSSKGTPRI
jgi:preprotein translocase subunit YajC